MQRRTTTTAVLAATLATAGLTGLAAAPSASAATSAVLVGDAPLSGLDGNRPVWFTYVGIDDGRQVTCLNPGIVGSANGRPKFATTYKVTAGTTYKVTAYGAGSAGCSGFAIGRATVTPTASDVADGEVYVSVR
ncbi:hypothetical protein ABZ078_10115 [Streptomyces sp. NPDC006385]|uniref:hypothetical protein n=1 Tax=Streptomyces sp. NPDC006385 TaxID=3156761 RepID=UPI0033B99FBC